MKLAIDAMGGDYAPSSIVQGAIQAVQEYDFDIILVGDEKSIQEEMVKEKFSSPKIIIKHTSQVVDMSEAPSLILRQKKDTSVRVAIDLVRSGEAQAVVSAGNSGVTMALSQLLLGKIQGVDRVAIAVQMPTLKGRSILIDAGANVDCKPFHLFQFAVMGEAYAGVILGLSKPKIGLLSIGEEDAKGNTLTKESFKLLGRLGNNFIGNVEGKDLFKGKADVVVCDGFVGNIALKIAEGVVEAATLMMKSEIRKRPLSLIGYLCIKPSLQIFKKKMDYAEHGGAPLLGLNNISIISHGRSSPKAIKNALKIAAELSEKRLAQTMAEELRKKMTQGAYVVNKN
jgi:glycerol-3-phosphate acyltransferase PlsX